MRYFTLQDIRKAAGVESSSFRSARTILKEAAQDFRNYKTYDIFLSHSFSDAELVLGAKKTLEREGYSVYVDWIEDAQLDRSNVTKETAQHIKDRMHIRRAGRAGNSQGIYCRDDPARCCTLHGDGVRLEPAGAWRCQLHAGAGVNSLVIPQKKLPIPKITSQPSICFSYCFCSLLLKLS